MFLLVVIFSLYVSCKGRSAPAPHSNEIKILLKGDEYEDHWLEVIRVHGGHAETIFSGLGYYL